SFSRDSGSGNIENILMLKQRLKQTTRLSAFHHVGINSPLSKNLRIVCISSMERVRNCNPIPGGRDTFFKQSGSFTHATLALAIIMVSEFGRLNLTVSSVPSGRIMLDSMNTPPVLRFIE